MSNQAFLVAPEALADTAEGAVVVLDGDEGHHAVTVKRIRAGEAIDLVDGRGRRAEATVTSTAKRSLEARVDRIGDEPAPGCRIVLVQALAKGDRDLQAVEAAVELGAGGVVPWQAERCVVRWQGDKAAKGRQKWEATVRSAVKQSRRAWVPDVEAAMSTRALSEWIRHDGGARLVLVMHEDAAEPLGERVRAAVAAEPDLHEIVLIVGPEGGISENEVEQLREAGAKPVVLGRHVLRSGTAGPAGIVLARHLTGWF
ncbi:16S rRNA (uracil(1498)-N(3))-methyltransferase [Zhihengliuella salsuginis]|uniref:Ribosomal RNA small subunit methyltransferase E n=1 Tax=Zhihengliuella salsuginis TaxID=578222 RepID=A0ABQ3GFN0_9MICC|nr:16S rRNA (uracil(1498)-N(3))-methyltransferase [Zhihengliuella salsuginis]GHD02102.1 ribosomal RNA small subunit methyltransferase E [Zhihengliuella salsuginis]